MALLFLISGHGDGDPGAAGNGYQEYERVRALAAKIKEIGGDEVILGDASKNWYKEKLFDTFQFPAGCSIMELHMDAGVSSAKGGHVIIKDGFSPDAYDNALAGVMAKYFPGRSQLIVGRDNLYNVNISAKRGLNYRLVEFGFITNLNDVNTFNTQMDAIATDVLGCFGIAGYGKLGAPVFIKQKETLDIGFNFCMPNNEGRFRWLLHDVAKGTWETLVDWTDSNWISLKKDKSGAGYLIQCQLYDLDTKEAHLLDTKTIGTDAGTGTIINGTYANTQVDGSILLGCSSNNPDAGMAMKVYNCTTQKWFTQFSGQWASFMPDKGTDYIVQFEAYAKDGTLLDYRSVGI